MNIKTNIGQLVGHTPLLEVRNLEAGCRVLVKIEGMNPGGSVKDRAALCMIEEAEQKGRLTAGATIIEPTSGNTGIGLAAIAGPRGYRVVIVMPENMSVERRRLMKAYGAELVLTPGEQGMAGAIETAKRLAAEIPGSWMAEQFENPDNALAHYRTTGPEIWHDTEGQIDMFVAGIGTGGTITGSARYLKQQKPDVTIIGVEPAASAVLSGRPAAAHGIQGIGAGFVPKALDLSLVDEVMTSTETEAYEAARALACREGILTGISGGAALAAALKQSRRPQNAGKTIVVLLPDTGDRYLSTPLYQNE